MESYQTEPGSEKNLERFPSGEKEGKFFNKENFYTVQIPRERSAKTAESTSASKTVFRLFVKHFEYVYARPDDIVMIESCDHLVRVYVGVGETAKLALRHNTLKDFLSQLPSTTFLRIGRFCAINMRRLTGGNCNDQVFEFDYKISIKLKHFVSHSVFTSIGV
jgi:LytTr DNA-binding domain